MEGELCNVCQVHELAVGHLNRNGAWSGANDGERMGGGGEVASASRVNNNGRGGTWRSRALFACVEARGATSRRVRLPSDLFLFWGWLRFAFVLGMALSLAGSVWRLVYALVLFRGP